MLSLEDLASSVVLSKQLEAILTLAHNDKLTYTAEFSEIYANVLSDNSITRTDTVILNLVQSFTDNTEIHYAVAELSPLVNVGCVIDSEPVMNINQVVEVLERVPSKNKFGVLALQTSGLPASYYPTSSYRLPRLCFVSLRTYPISWG